MIIDKKGKLFGKISIIDIIIVLVVVLAVAFVGYKFVKSGTTSTVFNKAQDVQMTFYVEEANDFTAKSINVGDNVVDFVQSTTIGKVTKVETAPSVAFSPTSDGKLVKASKEGYVSLKVTVEGKGTLGGNGLTISGNDYLIGQNYNVKLGKVQFEKAKVSDVGKKG